MMTILTHPVNVKYLEKYKSDINASGFVTTLYDFKVVVDANVKEYDSEYFLPKDSKFYGYEESDLPWLIYCGWAIEVRKPVFYLMRQDFSGTIYPKMKSYTPYR